MPMTGILKVGPVIPVIAIDDADKAVPLAHALIAGGISVLEITLRTPAAFDAVRQISAQVPDAVVGVGTITLPRQFEEAKAAGARFCVCPGLTPDLAKAAHSCGLPVLPGVMTPTEVIAAHGEGYRQLMLFPAEQVGGIAMLEALAGPFPDVIFCPTGGITAANATSYLALPNVICVGGTWLTPKDMIDRGDWPGITALAREASAFRPRD
jgi:2-dehydro-3-deoxyphosphogluconate aldolase/(4S)-4-hydroxy-2-oxoglutarate aldolase